MRRVNIDFWKGKRVFVSGHTGFKGSWLSLWLQQMGAIVKGYALAPPTNPSLFEVANVKIGMESEVGDIRDLNNLQRILGTFNPEIVLHLAAQPLVKQSYKDPVETFSTNVMGTVNLLEACRKLPALKTIVIVTSDKCYENKEWYWGYREQEPMGGYDPYSSSKGCSELVVAAYKRSFFGENNMPAIASARAGNVLGGGDWAKDRLIPDVLKAFEQGVKVRIRNPKAIRPWQHVLESLSGYLILAENLYFGGQSFAEAWNFGPREGDCKPVEIILDIIKGYWGNGASWGLDDDAHPHEAMFLKLDCSKSANRLLWYPRWNTQQTIQKIVDWHKAYLAGKDMRAYSLEEIKSYNT